MHSNLDEGCQGALERCLSLYPCNHKFCSLLLIDDGNLSEVKNHQNVKETVRSRPIRH